VSLSGSMISTLLCCSFVSLSGSMISLQHLYDLFTTLRSKLKRKYDLFTTLSSSYVVLQHLVVVMWYARERLSKFR
jgi:hypothetical protein